MTNKKRSDFRYWMLLPMGLSIGVLGWSFSLPLRNGTVQTQASAAPVGESYQSPRHILSFKRQRDAEEFRENALRADAELMRRRRDRQHQWQTEKLPSSVEAKAEQAAHRQRVTSKIEELANVESGSLQWQYRRDLENSLDQPQ